MRMHKLQLAALMAVGSLFAALPAFAADNSGQEQGSAVVTILPKSENPGGIPEQALQLKVDGKDSTITGWIASARS